MKSAIGDDRLPSSQAFDHGAHAIHSCTQFNGRQAKCIEHGLYKDVITVVVPNQGSLGNNGYFFGNT
jgi:hypothetical protein